MNEQLQSASLIYFICMISALNDEEAANSQRGRDASPSGGRSFLQVAWRRLELVGKKWRGKEAM